MAELADAPDLGSGVYDVQVQVLLPQPKSACFQALSCFCVHFVLHRSSKCLLALFAHFLLHVLQGMPIYAL